MQLNISYFIKKLLPSFSKDDSLEDLETWVTPEHFTLVDYKSHPAIKDPFSE